MELKKGQHILEMGVGTGLTLKYYSKIPGLKISGIDLSEKMIAKARNRAAKYDKLEADFTIMDAEATSFENNTFDKVVLMYVYSVTPNPQRLLSEAIRICKMEGSIFIVNHFSQSTAKRLSFFERLLKPFSRTLGFRSDFSFKENIEDLHLNIERIESANIFALTKIIELKKIKNLHLNQVNKYPINR
jgi:phosphatidylethanolamine/phosphatidyl-N-methylethanolamine N-methyltransferase